MMMQDDGAAETQYGAEDTVINYLKSNKSNTVCQLPCNTSCDTSELPSKKDTPRWVTTNTTSKKGLKGRLVVVVIVVGFV